MAAAYFSRCIKEMGTLETLDGAMVLCNLGRVTFQLGDVDGGLKDIRLSINLFDNLGYKNNARTTAKGLSLLLARLGKFE
jgi:hypothetical protein